MRITVRLHGDLRRHVSSNPLEIEMEEGVTVADVIAHLGLRGGEVWLATLEGKLVEKDYFLHKDDELSLIPPVGGG